MVVSLLFEDCLSPGGYVRRESPQDTKKLTASERRVLEFDVEGVGAEAKEQGGAKLSNPLLFRSFPL